MCQVMDLYLGDTNKDIYIGICPNVTHGSVTKKWTCCFIKSNERRKYSTVIETDRDRIASLDWWTENCSLNRWHLNWAKKDEKELAIQTAEERIFLLGNSTCQFPKVEKRLVCYRNRKKKKPMVKQWGSNIRWDWKEGQEAGSCKSLEASM